MTGRVLLAALLAGIVAGLIMGVIQHARLTPLILQAETFEVAHDHGAAEAEPWAPADGIERTVYTTLTAMVTGAAFAALLAGAALLLGLPLNARNGALWGLCGFLAVCLAPAAGLPPELPGMPAGDLGARQLWWVGTIVATGAGIALLAKRREMWAIALAAVLIALPHVVGAPSAESHGSAVPAGLAAAFAATSLAANAIFWGLIGGFLGFAFEHTVPEARHAA